MRNITILSLLTVLILSLLSCDKTANNATNQIQNEVSENHTKELDNNTDKPEKNTIKVTSSDFTTVEWIDLMPEEDLDALLNPPGYIDEIEDGSFEDKISNKILNTLNSASDDRYQQALVSTQIIPQMNGKAIRIPGFIVPLEFDEEQTIREFFLVPFYGACIHLPPPPPNQVIFVHSKQGIKLESLYEPYWVSGILQTSITENETATAAYSLKMQSFQPYAEQY